MRENAYKQGLCQTTKDGEAEKAQDNVMPWDDPVPDSLKKQRDTEITRYVETPSLQTRKSKKSKEKVR